MGILAKPASAASLTIQDSLSRVQICEPPDSAGPGRQVEQGEGDSTDKSGQGRGEGGGRDRTRTCDLLRVKQADFRKVLIIGRMFTQEK